MTSNYDTHYTNPDADTVGAEPDTDGLLQQCDTADCGSDADAESEHRLCAACHLEYITDTEDWQWTGGASMRAAELKKWTAIVAATPISATRFCFGRRTA